MTYDALAALRPLLTAEADAEAHATGTEPADLEQAVRLRLLEHLATDGPPLDPQARLRRAVCAESRSTRRTALRERPYPADFADSADPADDGERGPEQTVLSAARHRTPLVTARRPPTGRCARPCTGCPPGAPGSWTPCCRRRTSRTARSRGSWVSHREVPDRNVPDVWHVCDVCSDRRLRPVERGDRSVGPQAIR